MVFLKLGKAEGELQNAPAKTREVWIWVEPFRGKPPRWLGSLIQMGQTLAEGLDAGLAAIVLGSDSGEAVSALSRQGVHRIIRNDSAKLGPYDGSVYVQVLRQALAEYRPLVFLTAASVIGREVTARLTCQERSWFFPRCTGIYPSGPDSVCTSKVVFGGQMERWAEIPLDRLLVASMQVGLLPVANLGPPVKTPVVDLDFSSLAPQDRSLDIYHEEMGGLSIEDAEVVVAGGLGAGNPEGFQLVERLAKALGGVVAGTQAAVDRGWIPHSRQIGRSGLTVYPDLFVACGISGSVHFTSGMQDSGTIVAINTDPEAPIFRIADVKICGDLHRVIPSFLRQIGEKRKP